MKKRILSALLISSLMLSMTACGGKENTSESSDSTEVTTTTIAKEDDVTEAITTTAPQTTTEATTTTAPIPADLPDVSDLGDFISGTYFFDQNGSYYALNMVDKVFHEYENKTYDYVNGKIALTYDEKSIVNIFTGEVLLTAEDGCYIQLDTNSENRMLPIILSNSNFSGNTYSLGILDTMTGEWHLPLSSEYEVCKYLPKCNVFVYGDIVQIAVDSIYTGYYHNIETNICTQHDKLPFSQVFYSNNEGKLLVAVSDYYTSNDRVNNPAVYDFATGKLTKLGEGEYEYKCNIYSNDNRGGCLIDSDNGKCIVLDNDLNVVDYDLSGYDIEDFYLATSELVVFEANNPNGDNYVIVLDKNGQDIVEPIKDIIYDTCVIGEKVIISGNNSYIINCATGEINDKYKICNIDPNSGLVQVYEGDNYYLVDPADPDTLINPFQYQ